MAPDVPQHLDMFLFPMGRCRKLRVLVVAVQPYNHEEIVDGIMMHISKKKD